jgi:hypothetical protein
VAATGAVQRHSGLKQHKIRGLGRSGVALGLQVTSGAAGGLTGSWLAMGVAGGLWGLRLTSRVAGDDDYISNFYKCPKL